MLVPTQIVGGVREGHVVLAKQKGPPPIPTKPSLPFTETNNATGILPGILGEAAMLQKLGLSQLRARIIKVQHWGRDCALPEELLSALGNGQHFR